MRQHESNQHRLVIVIDLSDEPIFVPAYVKDRAFMISVGMREHLPGLRKVLPSGSLCHAIPRIKRFLGVSVSQTEFSQSLPTDDVQDEARCLRPFDDAKMVTRSQADQALSSAANFATNFF